VITAKAFSGRTYAVYGLARSGLTTVEALLASRAKVTAWDAKEEARAKAPAGTEIANLDEADLSQFDSLVVTPGLPLNRHPIAKRALEAGVEIIGDIELFARARPELPPHKVVGITGTNGKSTTTALVHHILKTAGVPTMMGGNIGLPILAQDPLPEGGVYVLELSSYQIDLTQSLDCDVAVLLNITPDHLDRYDSFEAYAASKARLFEMQSPEHAAIFNYDDEEVWRLIDRSDRNGWSHPSDQILVRTTEAPKELSCGRALQGPHNLANAICAMEVCRELGITDGVLAEGLRTYAGLPHRMERVREKDGVLFVNDSKATNPTATAPALAAFDSIRWILGGQAKTDNLDECAPHFGHVRSAYTIGDAADLFERLLAPHITVKNCGKLDEAVLQAAQDAEAGDTVLLSPACASFDQFRDFEDRGDQFKALVGAL
jgi:UDP-N-acetylmuramoylalanine--D-glutamate ligase